METIFQGRRIQWDDEKNLINLKKHGVSLKTARMVFADEDRLEWQDLAHSDDEERYKVLGRVGNILLVIYTQRGDVTDSYLHEKQPQKKERCTMATQEALVYEGQLPTQEELAEVNAADTKPVNLDDIPEISPEEIALLASIAKERRSARRKKTISIRLPQETIDKAKSMLGEGYTTVLGRVLVMAVDHPDIIKQCL